MTAAPGPAAGRSGVTPRRGWSELGPRVASALVMALVALVTAWIGGWIFDAVWLVAAIAVLSEWNVLIGLVRRDWTRLIGGLCLICATGGIARDDAALFLAPLVIGGAVSWALAQDGRRVLALAGFAYAGVLAVAVPLLRQSDPFGLAAILWLFAVVWGTDTLAFFGGRLIGGPKLAPRLSPSKTWSGFLVGTISGALLGLLVAPRSDCAICILAVGFVGGAIAQGGDLFESALKRRFGAKDAGSLIPGHGGFMDRLDGFVATSLFAAILGLWRFGPVAAGAGLFKW